MTQRQLAEKSKVSVSTISNLERGLVPTPVVRLAVAQALRVPAADLFPD